tara:strand:- start:211 stop:924 length:714 start_codon:yes stop_codon:yes gene_type:complete
MQKVCFIPARSGSTRLRNKNIKLINKRPLVYWTVLKAVNSKLFNKIIFSSDSKKYFVKLIYYLNKDKIDINKIAFDFRQKKHSRKKSKIFDYLKNDLIKKFNLQPNDLIVQMLPTCPLRSINTIKKLVNYSILSKKNSFSVSKYDFHISFALSINNNNWKPLIKNSPLTTGKTQSQTQKIFYHPNGALNCLYVKTLNSRSKSIYKNATPIVIPENEAHDVDNNHDFKLVKFIMEMDE